MGHVGRTSAHVGWIASHVGWGEGGPVITVQPVDDSARLGEYLSFTVAAVGAGTLHYQWRNGTAPITGATSSTYTFMATDWLDWTSYNCKVTDDNGSVVSNSAWGYITGLLGTAGTFWRGLCDTWPTIVRENVYPGGSAFGKGYSGGTGQAARSRAIFGYNANAPLGYHYWVIPDVTIALATLRLHCNAKYATLVENYNVEVYLVPDGYDPTDPSAFKDFGTCIGSSADTNFSSGNDTDMSLDTTELNAHVGDACMLLIVNSLEIVPSGGAPDVDHQSALALDMVHLDFTF